MGVSVLKTLYGVRVSDGALNGAVLGSGRRDRILLSCHGHRTSPSIDSRCLKDYDEWDAMRSTVWLKRPRCVVSDSLSRAYPVAEAMVLG